MSINEELGAVEFMMVCSLLLLLNLTLEIADEHFEILLNVLHFKTKNNFYTKSMYEAKDKYSNRRYNKGHSLVDQSIVSVGPLPEEYSIDLLPPPLPL
jgi:hypothetical protein